MICVQDASSQVAESIKISQGDKSSEADSLADKFSKVCSFWTCVMTSLDPADGHVYARQSNCHAGL